LISSSNNQKTKVVIAGASGFVGKALLETLGDNYALTGISRSGRSSNSHCRWVKGDLFSMLDCELALEGQDYAIYLVHSMLPSAKLVQGDFQDYDLVLADNFARAAAKTGIKKIIYLGGIIPEGESLSPHLESRLEVERTLASSGVPVISLRAGLIIGREGSSFQIMRNLVRKLPIMFCPSWTATLSSPIDLRDVCQIIAWSLDRTENETHVYDIGGADTLSYKEMMQRLAKKLNLMRIMFPVPFFSPGLSKLWVTLITGAPKNLVYPLVESLKSQMIPRAAQKISHIELKNFEQMLDHALSQEVSKAKAFSKNISLPENEVRSIQRLETPKLSNATAVANFYFEWLPHFLNPLIKVIKIENRVDFKLLGLKTPMLSLEYSPERSSPDRQLFYLQNCLLAYGEGRGRLEFRDSIDNRVTIAAIHEFKPKLPWFIYKYTQALVHLWVMKSFRKVVKKRL
tara:strand:+ start:13121 stop:14494 length:1374 start_codon:yes stop_codon:yes gene_type:complete